MKISPTTGSETPPIDQTVVDKPESSQATAVSADKQIPSHSGSPHTGKLIHARSVSKTDPLPETPELKEPPMLKTGISVTWGNCGPEYSPVEHYSRHWHQPTLPIGINNGAEYEALMTGSSSPLQKSMLGLGGNGYIQKLDLGGQTVVMKRSFSYPMANDSGSTTNIFLAGDAMAREAGIINWLQECPDHLNGKSHVISSIGSGVCNGEPFLILPFAEQGDLSHWIGQKTHSEDETIKLATDLFKGLAFMHSHDCTHMDIKSDNLLIDARGHLLIADPSEVTGESSLAAYTLNGEHSPLQLCGTPSTKPGGSFLFEPPGPHTDVWSAGLVMLEMVAGRELKDAFDTQISSIPSFNKAFTRLTVEEKQTLQEEIKAALEKALRQSNMNDTRPTQYLIIAIKQCFELDATTRPSAEDVLVYLERSNEV